MVNINRVLSFLINYFNLLNYNFCFKENKKKIEMKIKKNILKVENLK